jgi:hypothetical protein
VPPDLADDRGNREGLEAPPCGIEAIDGVEEPDRSDLDDVLELAAVSVATGERTHERKVEADELVASAKVAMFPV